MLKAYSLTVSILSLQDTNLLRDYIAYARDKVFPVLDDEAAEVLVDAYRNMRRIGKGRGQISAYPRQLESLIRLAEARAKVRLSFEVTKADVEEAIRYVSYVRFA